MRVRDVMLLLTVASVFSLIVVGAYVTAGGYGAACGTNIGTDWPLCMGNLLPPLQVGPMVEYSHRILASISTLFLFITTFLFWRGKDSSSSARKLLYTASVLIVVEIVLGGAVVTQELEAALVTLHQADALLIFGLTAAAGAVALSRPLDHK